MAAPVNTSIFPTGNTVQSLRYGQLSSAGVAMQSSPYSRIDRYSVPIYHSTTSGMFIVGSNDKTLSTYPIGYADGRPKLVAVGSISGTVRSITTGVASSAHAPVVSSQTFSTGAGGSARCSGMIAVNTAVISDGTNYPTTNINVQIETAADTFETAWTIDYTKQNGCTLQAVSENDGAVIYVESLTLSVTEDCTLTIYNSPGWLTQSNPTYTRQLLSMTMLAGEYRRLTDLWLKVTAGAVYLQCETSAPSIVLRGAMGFVKTSL